MNKVTRTTAWQRIRAAWRALIGKPADSITFGLEVKRCSDCHRGDCNDCHRGDCNDCDYKRYTERVSRMPDCNDCLYKVVCDHQPKIGEPVRINCPLWQAEE